MPSIFYKGKRYGGTIINEGTPNPIWGNIGGDITHQNDLINYLSTNYYKPNDINEPDIADNDLVPFYDISVQGKRNSTWANIKAKLSTIFMKYADKFINKMVTGTGIAGQDKGADVSPRYFPAKWTYDLGSDASEGNSYCIKIPSTAGHAAGVYMSVNNGSNYYPVVYNTTSRITTHFPANSCLQVVFDPNGSATTFPINGGDATTTVTGGVFRVINFYDSGNSSVTQTATSTNANYEVLFSVTADNTTRTEGARKASNLKFNPSTGNLQATQLNGVAIGSSPKFTDTQPNNATLTIQKNGSNVASFGANASSAVTANITVPTVYNGLDSTSTSAALTANQGYVIRNFLRPKSLTLTAVGASSNPALYRSGQVIGCTSVSVASGSYSGSSKVIKNGDYYYIILAKAALADVTTFLNNVTLSDGSLTTITGPVRVNGSSIGSATSYLLRSGSNVYLVSNGVLRSSNSTISLSNQVTLCNATRVFTSNLI